MDVNEARSFVFCPWWKARAAALQAARVASSGPGVSRASVRVGNVFPLWNSSYFKVKTKHYRAPQKKVLTLDGGFRNESKSRC